MATLTEAQVEDLVGAATAGLDLDDDAPFWGLVELLTRPAGLSDRELQLVTEILAVVARLNARPRGRGPGRRSAP